MVTIAMWTMIFLCTALFDMGDWEPWAPMLGAVGTSLTLLIDGSMLGGDED
jgi:hypothetical protein